MANHTKVYILSLRFMIS